MEKYRMDYFKELLLEQEESIDNTIRLMKEHNNADQNSMSPNELSNYDNHPGDLGSELYELEHNNALEVHEEHLLKEIQDALERIEDGSYGKCELCGDEIMEERLEVIPYARLCIDCENDKDITIENIDEQRHLEELIWDAPMGRKYLNKREDDEFEGLDQFNDLMKYGSSDTPQDLGGYYDYEEYYTNELDMQGIVDRMDNISNGAYRRQLPD